MIIFLLCFKSHFYQMKILLEFCFKINQFVVLFRTNYFIASKYIKNQWKTFFARQKQSLHAGLMYKETMHVS